MKAGALRNRIQLQHFTATRDEWGSEVKAWVDAFPAITAQYGGIPAEWLPGPGKEYLAADAIRAEVEGRLRIRHLPGVTAQMRVLWDGQMWEIKAPPLQDPTLRREMVLMVARAEGT